LNTLQTKKRKFDDDNDDDDSEDQQQQKPTYRNVRRPTRTTTEKEVSKFQFSYIVAVFNSK